MKEKKTIGRTDWVDFPDLNLSAIPAKIDTGAYTTALHCQKIYLHPETGALCFIPLSPEFDAWQGQEISTHEFRKKTIKNSFGEAEERYLIKTRIRIGKRLINSVISLTHRGTMRFPVLVGRKILKKRFLVDVEKEFLYPSSGKK
jgi:hypothetical protein